MSKREKILLLVALLAALGFVYFNYFFTPVQKKAQELETSIQENKIKAGELQGYLQNIDTKRDELALVEAQYQEAIAKIPAELDQTELLVEIDRIADGRGDIASLIFLPVEERSFYKASPVNLEIFCRSYGDMCTVLSELKDSAFLNLVRDLNIDTMAGPTASGEEETGPVNRLDVVLTIDFLCLTVNETEPGQYTFMDGGTYGSDDLFRGIR